MKRTTLAVLAAEATHRPMVRAVDLQTGEERLIDPARDVSTLGVAAAAAARADRSGEIEIEGKSWFLGVHNPPLELILVGAVHIAQPLSRMALLAGYGVRVIDPRSAFATPERFPGVRLEPDWPDQALARTPPTARAALVVLAHDPKIDDPALTAALGSPCFYVGALGSKKSHATRLARLAAAGFSEAALARIHGPVGLAIGARSPGEIAVSILAEITQILRA